MTQAHKTALSPNEHERLVRLGDFFKAYRLKSGLSIDEVAQLLDLKPAVYVGYEEGRQSMPLEDVFALTNLLNIAPEEVMDLVHGLYKLGTP
jgi:transcriptional regulator with XRE-family HTH domain